MKMSPCGQYKTTFVFDPEMRNYSQQIPFDHLEKYPELPFRWIVGKISFIRWLEDYCSGSGWARNMRKPCLESFVRNHEARFQGAHQAESVGAFSLFG